MSRRRRDASAGVTMVELMVVLAIVGVLSAAAVLAFDRPRDAGTVADLVVSRVRECVRMASSRGTVRDDVAAEGFTARARLVLEHADGGPQMLRLELLAEDPPPASTASWGLLGQVAIGPDVRVVGFRDEAALTASTPETAIDDAPLEIECFPDGSTAARTLFLQGSNAGDRARVTILPLTGESIAAKGW